MKQKINNTEKDIDGDILSLCSPDVGFRVSKPQAIVNIESAGNENSPYYTVYGGVEAKVFVVGSGADKYLRTDPDKTTRNNLAELPDC